MVLYMFVSIGVAAYFVATSVLLVVENEKKTGAYRCVSLWRERGRYLSLWKTFMLCSSLMASTAHDATEISGNFSKARRESYACGSVRCCLCPGWCLVCRQSLMLLDEYSTTHDIPQVGLIGLGGTKVHTGHCKGAMLEFILITAGVPCSA